MMILTSYFFMRVAQSGGETVIEQEASLVCVFLLTLRLATLAPSPILVSI